jgi:imidazolonepropionase
MMQQPLPPVFCDVFVERGYFDLAQAERVRRTAVRLGMQLKAHVDEFADLGGVAWAVEHGAVSVEHLLSTGPQGIAQLAASSTVAVGLPLTSLYLRETFAPLRALVDAGALVALGTDCNPGSAMTTNLPFALQMAVLGNRLSPPEALRAATVGGAKALAHPAGFTGCIEAGKPFLASVFSCDGPDRLFYELAAPPRALTGWLPV